MDVTFESRAEPCTIGCRDGEPVLFAGLRAGLTLPYDCATGTCGMCKARVKSGEVETLWPDAPALAKLQRDKGDILMCQARALSPCVLRVPGQVACEGTRVLPDYDQGRITSVRALTSDVLAFDLTLAAPLAFAAGQFAVLSVPSLTGGRAYSMVNFADTSSVLEFVVKKRAGGALSDWLFARDRTGELLGLFGPLGRATFRPGEDRNLVCIAGGSGIAGIVSILEHASASGHFARHGARVFFGVRTLADGFYLDRFDRLVAGSNWALEVVLALSHENSSQPVHPEYPRIKLAHGFVHEVADARLPAACENVSAFVAGPPPMVDGAIRMLIGHGVASASIRYDKFG